MSGPLDLFERILKEAQQWGGNSMPTISHDTIHVHEGNMYTFGAIATGVADNAQLASFLYNPIGDKEAHLEATFAAGGLAYVFLYEDAEIQSTGTLFTPQHINRVRASEGLNPPEWRVTAGSAVKTLGNLIRTYVIPGNEAAGPQAAMVSGFQSNIHWILDPNKVYLGIVINLSGSTVFASFSAEFSEHAQSDFGSIS